VPLTSSAVLARPAARAALLVLGLGLGPRPAAAASVVVGGVLGEEIALGAVNHLVEVLRLALEDLLDVAVRVGVLLGDGGEVLGQPLLVGISGLPDGIGTVDVEGALEVDQVVELVDGVGALREPLEEHTSFFAFLVQLAEEAEQDEIHVAQVVGEALKVHKALADGPRLDAPVVGALGIGRVIVEAPELRAVVQVVPREDREVVRVVGLVLDVAAILHNQAQFLGRERVTGVGLRTRAVRPAVAARAWRG